MQFPSPIPTRPSSGDGPRRACRSLWLWAIIIAAIAAAGIFITLSRQPAPRVEDAAVATLVVGSAPSGATVEVDARARGRTPVDLPLEPGEHRVRLRRDGYFDADYRLSIAAGQTVALSGELWQRTPAGQRLRPPFPGSTISGADFLTDGRIALTLALPSVDEQQLWLVDGQGGLSRFGPPRARGPLAVAPDGTRIAYLAQGQASPAGAIGREKRFDEVWLAKRDGEPGERRWATPGDATDQRLVGLSWAPDGRHLLVLIRQQPAGGGLRTRLLWLDAAGGEGRELYSLPAEVVAGSLAWSPGGERVAFLTRTGQLTSLCLLALSGEFRYLADLGRDTQGPLPFPPLAWSPDARLMVYAAPTQDGPPQPVWFFGSRVSTGLFSTEPAQPRGQRLGTAEGQSPAWLRDDRIVALARPKAGGPLVLRAIDLGGESRDLGDLPLKPNAHYAARWDVRHAQALVATGPSATLGPTPPEYWLLRFRPEVAR